MESAFDILAAGGKAGKFELRDMAQELPSLAPAFAALGYEGEEGLRRLTAALQIVRRETGTSGEAATAFMDVISKMETENVSKQFAKFGIDLRKELAAARAEGRDLLTVFTDLAVQAVDGDLSKLPQLFTDKQMLVGMRGLINGGEDLQSMFLSLANSVGTVNADIQRLGTDGQASIDRMSNAWKNLKRELGETVAPAATGLMDGLAQGLDFTQAFNKGLEETGTATGFLDRTLWGIGQNSGPFSDPTQQQLDMARIGGYLSPAERSGHFTVPQADFGFDPFTAAPSAPAAQRAGLVDSDMAAVLAQMEDGGAALADGGQQAGDAILAAGPEAGRQMGDMAGAALRASASEIGAVIGQAAATQIRAAASGLQGAAGRYARRQADANTGTSFPDAGRNE
jgi:hypothetical protein